VGNFGRDAKAYWAEVETLRLTKKPEAVKSPAKAGHRNTGGKAREEW